MMVIYHFFQRSLYSCDFTPPILANTHYRLCARWVHHQGEYTHGQNKVPHPIRKNYMWYSLCAQCLLSMPKNPIIPALFLATAGPGINASDDGGVVVNMQISWVHADVLLVTWFINTKNIHPSYKGMLWLMHCWCMYTAWLLLDCSLGTQRESRTLYASRWFFSSLLTS